MNELKHLCSLRNHHDRIQGILELQTNFDCQLDQYRGVKSNIYTYLDRDKSHTVALTCHHDIVNMRSENCLDNNASIYNLLKLLEELDLSRLQYNALIAFVDEEESGGYGIRRMVDRWQFDWHLDLELTATGTYLCYTPYGDCSFLLDSKFRYKKQPPNNAYVASSYSKTLGRSYSGACLTMIDEKGFMEQYCDNWTKIHTEKDCFALANEDDMRAMREHLAELLYRDPRLLNPGAS
jgi:hypothetical protein